MESATLYVYTPAIAHSKEAVGLRLGEGVIHLQWTSSADPSQLPVLLLFLEVLIARFCPCNPITGGDGI